jgi:hypothetical protein
VRTAQIERNGLPVPRHRRLRDRRGRRERLEAEADGLEPPIALLGDLVGRQTQEIGVLIDVVERNEPVGEHERRIRE